MLSFCKLINRNIRKGIINNIKIFITLIERIHLNFDLKIYETYYKLPKNFTSLKV